MKKKDTKKIKINTGKKAHFDNKAIKVGRIKWNSWAKKVLAVGDIIIYETELAHVLNRHSIELAQIGLSALDYAKFIIENFNEVREGSAGAFLLVVKRDKISNVAAIELIMLEEPNQYKIKSLFLINNIRLNKKTLLCATVR